MSKKKYSLKKPAIRNYPTITAVYGKANIENVNPNLTTKPMSRRKKKRFGITKKSEE